MDVVKQEEMPVRNPLPIVRTVMDAVTGYVAYVDKEGRYVFVNRLHEQFYGIPREQIEGTPVLSLLPAELHQRYKQAMEQCLQGRRVESDFEMTAISGASRSFHMLIHPLQQADGVTDGAVVILKEISKQREICQRLTEAERIGRTGSWEWYITDNKLVWSEGMYRLLGLDPERFTPSAEEFLARIHPDDRERLAATVRKYSSDVYCDFRVILPDGRVRVLQFVGETIVNSQDIPVKMMGTAVDITERKEVEELQRNALSTLEDYARSVLDAGGVLDEEGHLLMVFGSREELTYLPKEEIVGRKISEFLPETLTQQTYEHMAAVLKDGNHVTYQFEFNVKTDRRTWEATLAPMRVLINGKRTLALHILDITEKQKHENRLKFAYERHRCSEFFNDLLTDSYPQKQVVQRLCGYGIDCSKPLTCLLLAITGVPEEKTDMLQRAIMPKAAIKEAVIEWLVENGHLWVWTTHYGIGLLVQGQETSCGEKMLGMDVAQTLKSRLDERFPYIHSVLGVSHYQAGDFNFSRLYHEALGAAMAIFCNGKEDGLCHYREIGIYQILFPLHHTENMDGFIMTTLGPLLEYERRHGGGLLATLEEIIAGESLKCVADKMFIHHNTVIWRKRRIETILGLSLDNFEHKMQIASAVKLWKVKTKLAEWL